MTQTKLSPLAEKLFDKLNSISHICSIESAALELAEDNTIAPAHRAAYREIYQFCQNDY